MKNANPVSSFPSLSRLALAVVCALAFGGCGRSEPAKTDTPRTVADYFPIKVGAQTVQMQLAVRMPEMQRGLMERRDLGPDQGMIFVYARPQEMSFWMRNTPTALDIGFFSADGVLREVYPLYPHDETPVKSRSDQLQFALEMNQGWFKAKGVQPGAQLDLKALTAALKARGFPPRGFGLNE